MSERRATTFCGGYPRPPVRVGVVDRACEVAREEQPSRRASGGVDRGSEVASGVSEKGSTTVDAAIEEASATI